MKFNFDEQIDRKNSYSLKWDVKDGELPMWVADMDFQTAPEVTAAIVERAKHGVFGYNVVADEWFDAIIGWWKTRHSFEIKREWLQFCTGVVPAVSSIIKRVTNVGDNVVVMTPVYNIFFNSIENAGRHVLENKLRYADGKYEIDFDDLESRLSNSLSTLLILCNPHNPIGKTWSVDELKKIGELCKKFGVIVLSDEIHCDLTSPLVNYIPFASVSETCKDISITCISASKAFNLAGLQSAAVFVPNENLRNKVVRGLNSDEVAEPNCFAEVSTIAAFCHGEEWLDELRAYLFENRKVAEEYLKNNVPNVRLIDGDATYLLWIDCGKFTDDAKQFCAFLRKTTGLYISCGRQYRGDSNTFVRMNIACPRSLLLDGLSRFEIGVKTFMKR